VIQNLDCDYPSMTSLYVDAGIDQCHFQASFVPTAAGARSAILTFAENPGTNATLSLTGTGVAPTSGERAAAIKRCKKKFPKGSAKRRKCLRRARKLPL
jgi:hypothetical protein